MEIQKNNVSYFQAGFEAAMRLSGESAGEVRKKFYSSIEYPNLMRRFLRAYDSEETDGAGAVAMHDEITKYELEN